MSIKERIHAAIETVSDDDLDELLRIVQKFTSPPTAVPGESIMDKLQRIQIEGPPDFSENFDQYVSGEKRV
jgi:hypothetical protein